MEKQPKYEIVLTEKQLSILQNVCESYCRLRLNQWFDFADEIAHTGYVYDQTNPENTKLFRDYIDRRNEAVPVFEKAFKIAQPFWESKTETMRIVEDMYNVIRHQRWIYRNEPKPCNATDSYRHAKVGNEPVIKIKKINE